VSESALEKSIIDTITEYNEARRGGASLFHIEYNFPDADPDEISEILERLVLEGNVKKENHLYYTAGK
jgi:hypothetical protein